MSEYEFVFEHRLPTSLTKESFALALLEFVRRPQNYIEALEDCEILEETSQDEKRIFRRKLKFPTFSFEDRVVLTQNGEFIEEVPAIAELPASRFSISFEAHSQARSEVLFTYHEKEKLELPQNIKNLRQAAWVAKDKALMGKLEAQFGLSSN